MISIIIASSLYLQFGERTASIDEASQCAEFVAFLKEHSKISDYNQVALLLSSVKEYKSNVYVKALKQKGIAVYCSRDGTYFDLEEVVLITGCFANIFNYSVTQSLDVNTNNRVPEYIKQAQIWDLKTSRPPEPDSVALENYERQLYM